VNSTGAFVALVVGILAILGTLGRISFQLGVLITRFNGHVQVSDRVEADHEQRLRVLEGGSQHRRPGA
jgi:hypothetical protein